MRELQGLLEVRGIVISPARALSFPGQMIDIHCHILPGLDDGAESIEVACAMAEMAIEDGITHVIGTPHASPNHEFIPDLVKQRRDEIQSLFEGRLDSRYWLRLPPQL